MDSLFDPQAPLRFDRSTTLDFGRQCLIPWLAWSPLFSLSLWLFIFELLAFDSLTSVQQSRRASRDPTSSNDTMRPDLIVRRHSILGFQSTAIGPLAFFESMAFDDPLIPIDNLIQSYSVSLNSTDGSSLCLLSSILERHHGTLAFFESTALAPSISIDTRRHWIRFVLFTCPLFGNFWPMTIQPPGTRDLARPSWTTIP